VTLHLFNSNTILEKTKKQTHHVPGAHLSQQSALVDVRAARIFPERLITPLPLPSVHLISIRVMAYCSLRAAIHVIFIGARSNFTACAAESEREKRAAARLNPSDGKGRGPFSK
jgi:hypothetical protein